MTSIRLLTTFIMLIACTGCASVGAYTFTKNGCTTNCSKTTMEEKTEYFLGTRLSYGEITSPHANPSYTYEIAVKTLCILDFPLTVVADVVMSPFIGVKNFSK